MNKVYIVETGKLDDSGSITNGYVVGVYEDCEVAKNVALSLLNETDVDQTLKAECGEQYEWNDGVSWSSVQKYWIE